MCVCVGVCNYQRSGVIVTRRLLFSSTCLLTLHTAVDYLFTVRFIACKDCTEIKQQRAPFLVLECIFKRHFFVHSFQGVPNELCVFVFVTFY